MPKVYIQSIGTAVPPNKIYQQLHYSILESANGMSREEKLKLHAIYKRSGISTRHSVLSEFGEEDKQEHVLFHPANHHSQMPVSQRMNLFDKHASELGADAVRNCLTQIPSLSPAQITHLITFSCTGMSAPGLDIQLSEILGFPGNIEKTCINFMGCYAAINAMKMANHIARSQPDAIVLIVGVELCTLHYRKSEDDEQAVANAIFADGAAAAIISSRPMEIKLQQRKILIHNFYAEYKSEGIQEMVWRIGDFGFDLRLSAYVPDLIRKNINDITTKLFERSHIQQEDISFYAIHPGGVKILQACEEALNITKEQNEFSYKVLREFGNMSSVTILFVLQEYLNTFSESDAGKKIFACAFGPGLTIESMFAEVN